MLPDASLKRICRTDCPLNPRKEAQHSLITTEMQMKTQGDSTLQPVTQLR